MEVVLIFLPPQHFPFHGQRSRISPALQRECGQRRLACIYPCGVPAAGYSFDGIAHPAFYHITQQLLVCFRLAGSVSFN